MKKDTVLDIIYAIALGVMLAGALLADGLGRMRGGLLILAVLTIIDGVLALIGNYLEREIARQRRRRGR